MKLLLNCENHKNIEREINEQLEKLRTMPANDKTAAAEIAECVSRIHSHDLSQTKLPIYDAQWVVDLVRENENCECKDEIISALEYMSKFERYSYDGSLTIEKDKFMTYNVDDLRWQGEYKSGHTGSYVWDIAAIINHINDPSFSDTFLESYMRHSGKEFTLAGLYSNLYYVQVAEAVMADEFEEIIRTTRDITERKRFKSEMISDETLNRLRVNGF